MTKMTDVLAAAAAVQRLCEREGWQFFASRWLSPKLMSDAFGWDMRQVGY